jgi:hypothetical protein
LVHDCSLLLCAPSLLLTDRTAYEKSDGECSKESLTGPSPDDVFEVAHHIAKIMIAEIVSCIVQLVGGRMREIARPVATRNALGPAVNGIGCLVQRPGRRTASLFQPSTR